MLIRFLTGPRKGQTEHAERSQTTKLLIDAGMIEVAELAQPDEQPGVDAFKKPAAPLWKIGRGLSGGIVFLQLTTPVIGEVVHYSLEPDDAPAYFERFYKQCCPIPAAVLEAYKAERTRPGSSQPTRQERLEADAARMRELMAGREPSTSWLDGGK